MDGLLTKQAAAGESSSKSPTVQRPEPTSAAEVAKAQPGRGTANDETTYTRSAFARWLQEQLRAHDWSIRTFAYRVGTQQATVRQWLHGRSTPSWGEISKIALAVGTDPDTILSILSGGADPGGSVFGWTTSWNGWTPDDLAAEVGVDVATVRFWLLGLLAPSSAQVRVLSAALRVPVETVHEMLRERHRLSQT